MWKTVLLVVLVAIIASRFVHSQRDLATREEGPQQPGEFIEEMFVDLRPEADVARLWSEIAAGTVRFDWEETGSATVGSFNHDGGNETFRLNPNYVRPAMGDRSAKLRLETFVLHEAVHHRQYHEHPDKGDASSCTEWWANEREAYSEQCRYARSAGTAHLLGFCSITDPDVFRHNLLARLLSRDSNGSECRSEFRQLVNVL